MMRGIRRLAVCAAAAGLLTAGAVSASMEVAHADVAAASCFGASDISPQYECTLTAAVNSAAVISVTVTDDVASTNEDVTVEVTTLSCTDSTGTVTEPASSATGPTPLTDALLPLPATAADGQCNVTATVSLPKRTLTKASSAPR